MRVGGVKEMGWLLPAFHPYAQRERWASEYEKSPFGTVGNGSERLSWVEGLRECIPTYLRGPSLAQSGLRTYRGGIEAKVEGRQG